MKKNDYDFSVPNRQSYVALAMILFKTINVVIRQIFPVLVIILLGGSKQKGDFILWLVIILACITMLYSIVNFFRTYFIVQNDELVLHTGIFSRKKISMPFARIQTINFEQNIIHRFFSVSRIKIDTAGSEKNEFEFHALENVKAHALRDLVLSSKNMDNSFEINAEHQHDLLQSVDMGIMSLSPSDLLKVGLTENHIKSGFLIFLFFFWIYQNLQEVGLDVEDYSRQMPEWEFGMFAILSFVLVLLFFSVIISLVRSLINHWDMIFLRTSGGFKIISGLFTKKEISARDHKIQHISWSDNLLKRCIGFKDLSLYQATGSGDKSGQNIRIPGCSMKHINGVVDTLFGVVGLDDIQMSRIDIKYFTRYATIIVFFLLIVGTVTWMIQGPAKILPECLIALYFIITRYISFRKKHFGVNDEILYVRGGIFGDKNDVLPMFKIQALELHESPYQRRHSLCTVTLYTAAGRINIPYIDLFVGRRLMDLTLYKAESDKRAWM